MGSSIQRLLCIGFVLLVSGGGVISPSILLGQGFLEQLEAKVRAQLQAVEGGQNAEGELPAPDSAAAPAPRPTAQDASNLPSILDRPAGAPIVPDPVEVPDTAPPSGGAGRIFLGLEAEEMPPGGGIGVRVTSVTERSPAWKAGFDVGDRVLAVNGFAIKGMDSMIEQLGKTSPGQTVKFLVLRGDRNIELVAVLMDAELATRINGGPLPIGELTGPAWLGVLVNDLTPSFRQQFGLTVFRGAAVTSVVEQSPASKAGIRAGDAIIEMGGQPMETARDLMAWMSTARPGQSVEVIYYRGASPYTATLVLEVTPENRHAAARTVLPGSTQSATNQARVSKPPTNQLELAPPPSSVPSIEPNQPAPPSRSPGGETQNPSRVQQLENEVARLQAELEAATQKLEATQKRLKQIVEGLDGIE